MVAPVPVGRTGIVDRGTAGDRARGAERAARRRDPAGAARPAEPRRSRQDRRRGGAGVFRAPRDRRQPAVAPRPRHRHHADAADARAAPTAANRRNPHKAAIEAAKAQIQPLVLEHMDVAAAAEMPRAGLRGAADRLGQGTARRDQDPAELRRAARAGRVADRRHAGPRAPRAAARRRDGHRHHGQRPEAGLRRAPRQARADRRAVPRRPACDEHRDQDRHPRSAAASTSRGRWSTPASPTAAASTSSSRRWRSTAPRSRSANSPRRRSPSTSWRASGSISPAMATVLKIAAPLPAQHPDLRRHRLGQDDAAQRDVADDRHRRAHRHDRGRRRAAAAAAACRPPRDPHRQPRRHRRDHHARSVEERAAYAARPHHHRRVPRRGSARHAAGDEHRP